LQKYEKLTTILQVSYENVKFADLQKTYENFTTNFEKFLRRFENRAPAV